jgi:hypothetical protein
VPDDPGGVPQVANDVATIDAESPAAASLSMITVASGCSCRIDAGQASVTGPSTAAATAAALWGPEATSTIFVASKMVPRPWVRQCVGTSCGRGKNRALSALVVALSRESRVREANAEPGSLKPRCAFRPIPRSWIPTPPRRRIASSKAAQAVVVSAAFPSGTSTFSGRTPHGSAISRRTKAW